MTTDPFKNKVLHDNKHRLAPHLLQQRQRAARRRPLLPTHPQQELLADIHSHPRIRHEHLLDAGPRQPRLLHQHLPTRPDGLLHRRALHPTGRTHPQNNRNKKQPENPATPQ